VRIPVKVNIAECIRRGIDVPAEFVLVELESVLNGVPMPALPPAPPNDETRRIIGFGK
jgi:hypothetical protein